MLIVSVHNYCYRMSCIIRNVSDILRGARVCQTSRFSTIVENTANDTKIFPIISTKSYDYGERIYQNLREVWLENMDTIVDKKLGIVTLHPDVYATAPRVDIIHENVKWQRLYRWISYANAKTRAETHHSNRKPWPQKGLGRARHGSRGSPLWKNGGKAHGPRSPTPHFYMLPFYTRIAGLTSSLSVKLAQDDLHLVTSLDVPTTETSYMEELIERRNWGPSVLFVDSSDVMPQNITIATNTVGHLNLMPVYSLNVYSILKHDTLILTVAAARLIEEKILFHLHRTDNRKFLGEFKVNQQ